jgi:hypothetical protein
VICEEEEFEAGFLGICRGEFPPESSWRLCEQLVQVRTEFPLEFLSHVSGRSDLPLVCLRFLASLLRRDADPEVVRALLPAGPRLRDWW